MALHRDVPVFLLDLAWRLFLPYPIQQRPTCGNWQMHGAKGTRSGPVAECSWQCLHCLLASLNKGHLASFLVQCKQCVNEWSGTKWSWMREHSVCYLHLPMHETWLPTNVVSWRSAKLSWSERTWRRHIISFSFYPDPHLERVEMHPFEVGIYFGMIFVSISVKISVKKF